MAGKLNPQILAQHVHMQAEARPDHKILTFEDPDPAKEKIVTYGSLHQGATALAGWFNERGLQSGDKVAILMRNHPEFVEALVAVTISGVVLVPIDPRTRGAKLSYQLSNAGARMVLCTDDLVEHLTEDVLAPTRVESCLLLRSDTSSPLPDLPVETIDYAGIRDQDWPAPDHRVQNAKQPMQIIYTSGTTGDPKGVVLGGDRAASSAMLASGVFGYKPDHVLYTGLSLTHGNAQMVTCFPAIYLGNHAVISERFTRTRIWDICRRYGVRTWSNLGGIISGVYNMPPRDDDRDHQVEYIISAGTPRAIWQPFMDRFGVDILEWYAAVEGGMCWKPRGQGPVGSFGQPMPGMLDVRVVREDDSDCEPGETGELISRPAGGGRAEVEYYGNKKASEEKTAGGWLRSGNMVHRDEEGWLFFDFRKGGGIRRNGDFIATDFIERVIGEHEDIAEVFVYGIPAASGAPGESDVVAAIVAAGPGTPDLDSLRAKCRRELEPNMVPGWLQLVPEIPKTISEKPQARFLQEQFRPDAERVFSGS